MSATLLMARRPRNLQFAAAVQRIVGNRSNRDVMFLTGVSHTYVGDWKFGSVPTARKLAEFVEGCRQTAEETDPPGIRLTDADERELYRAAGYLGPDERLAGYAPLDGAPDARPLTLDEAIDQAIEVAEREELSYEADLGQGEAASATGELQDPADLALLARIAERLRERKRGVAK